jgi:hypothetical protein
LKKLNSRLEVIEAKLKKVRGCSPLTDGWQTQRLAKKSRAWDVLAKQKMAILKHIEDLEYEINN